MGVASKRTTQVAVKKLSTNGHQPSKERQRDRARTKSDILTVATQEFAEKGYLGARVDDIATLTRTTKRMIYYYYESKEGLYRAALQHAYEQIVVPVERYGIEGLAPMEAIRQVAKVTFDLHDGYPYFARLISLENMNRGRFIGGDAGIEVLPRPIIPLLRSLLKRGRAEGTVKREIDAWDVHMFISSLCFFRVNNRFTFEANFGRDLMAPRLRTRYRNMVGDAVVALLSGTADEE
ncbi:MAG TPA: TetR family transcriptional regulator [Acidimicrobiales bacterium]|jgi:AcrR family transcriptional regulator|nr:TetR family transcriptional regulator [Acidimicrobiales bacterium]